MLKDKGLTDCKTEMSKCAVFDNPVLTYLAGCLLCTAGPSCSQSQSWWVHVCLSWWLYQTLKFSLISSQEKKNFLFPLDKILHGGSRRRRPNHPWTYDDKGGLGAPITGKETRNSTLDGSGRGSAQGRREEKEKRIILSLLMNC